MNGEHLVVVFAIGVFISQQHMKWEELGKASAAHRREACLHRELSHQTKVWCVVGKSRQTRLPSSDLGNHLAHPRFPKDTSRG